MAQQKKTSQPPVFFRNAFVERGFDTGGQTQRGPFDLPSTSRLEPLHVNGRLTGPQTGGLKISKSFIHRRFRGRTGGPTKPAVCQA